MGRQDYETETLIAHSLRAEGFDASEDGTGRGTPLVPVHLATHEVAGTMMSYAKSGGDSNRIDNAASGYMAITGFQSSQSGVREVDAHATLDSNNGSRRHNGVIQGSAVRRLTPRECERLQGFPGRYSLVPYRGKPAADGPRYKALGNSMAVPVMRYIGERIAQVEAIQAESLAA